MSRFRTALFLVLVLAVMSISVAAAAPLSQTPPVFTFDIDTDIVFANMNAVLAGFMLLIALGIGVSWGIRLVRRLLGRTSV